MCSKHKVFFIDVVPKRLKANAIPSVFSWNTTPERKQSASEHQSLRTPKLIKDEKTYARSKSNEPCQTTWLHTYFVSNGKIHLP